MFNDFFQRSASIYTKLLRISLATAFTFAVAPHLFNLATDKNYTDEEREILTNIFQDSLNLDDLHLKQSKIVDKIVGWNDGGAVGNYVMIHSRFNNYDSHGVEEWVFVHEHAHAWQHKYCDKEAPSFIQIAYEGLSGTFKTPKHTPYRYKLELNKDLSEYNHEQQANIIADYFKVRKGNHALWIDVNQRAYESLHLYESVLENFFKDPTYIRHHCQNIHTVYEHQHNI